MGKSSATLVVLLAVTLVAAGSVSAVPDSLLCPFELGYNPSFSADGSKLFCSKGQEIFQVDDAGILARSLRGIGTSAQAIVNSFITGDLSVFVRLADPAVEIALPDGPHPLDADVVAFIQDTFTFPPGVDSTAVLQVSDYHFLSNDDPRTATVHVKVFAAEYTIEYDTLWLFNLVNGTRVWQLKRTYNPSLEPN
ncbi:hypothetical protein KFL_002300010 [Klebsormidium nitens]|uniref:Uncharacterized protein n=1 Tax=Klebsormidium nitens TaxID=105231 RepID=A0A1Y1I7C8_KLENI|nr:hypothetical protein KFL_002300010 [Klebsormidium nitens]|eukprot:GAQ85329.1 hypothetical protein KFL_002300010 [Klebsormidium nitens]